jgi:hypothetical protein
MTYFQKLVSVFGLTVALTIGANSKIKIDPYIGQLELPNTSIEVGNPAVAGLDDWTGIDNLRKFFSGRLFTQYFVNERSAGDLASFKNKFGEDAGYNKMQDWCNDQTQYVLNREFDRAGLSRFPHHWSSSMPTFRVEGDKVNCYARVWKFNN